MTSCSRYMSSEETTSDQSVVCSSKKSGLFSHQRLLALAQDGHIDAALERIRPASIDLSLATHAHRMRASFLPGPQRSVADCIESDQRAHSFSLEGGAVLERGCVYLIALEQLLDLPSTVQGVANPRSSTGRIDVFARLITDRGVAFDRVVPGYSGPAYVEIIPRTFPLLVRPGTSLNQLRLFEKRNPLSEKDYHAMCAAHQDASPLEGLTISLALDSAAEHIGYVARRHCNVIDADALGTLRPADFWRPLAPCARLVLEPGEFYLLRSHEDIAVAPDMVADMVAIDPVLGEYRAHYAGFFDPGFGFGRPSKAVLEVRSLDAPFLVENRQAIARLLFERLDTPATLLYGQDGGFYQGQTLRLSRHFAAEWGV